MNANKIKKVKKDNKDVEKPFICGCGRGSYKSYIWL